MSVDPLRFRQLLILLQKFQNGQPHRLQLLRDLGNLLLVFLTLPKNGIDMFVKGRGLFPESKFPKYFKILNIFLFQVKAEISVLIIYKDLYFLYHGDRNFAASLRI